MKNTVKNILILIIALAASYFLGFLFGRLYMTLIPNVNEGFFSFPSQAAEYIIGWPLSCIFFLLFLFTAFGGTKKYWWIGVALIPAILFEVTFDLQHIYFPVAIGLVGWLLGKGLSMLIAKHKL